MALVDIIDSVTPGWAKDRPWWWNLFRMGAGLVDGLLEGVYQGIRAGFPNQIDGPGVVDWGGFTDMGVLAKIARDRGVIQGLTERPDALAFRLRHYQDPAAGGWPAPPILGMFEQLAGVLSGPGAPAPLMRMIFLDNSNWWTREQDGTIRLDRPGADGFVYNLDGTTTRSSVFAKSVSWDNATDPPPPDQGFVGRWVLVIYRPVNAPFGTDDDKTFNDPGICGDLWNAPTTPEPSDPWPDAGTIGTNAPAKLVDVVRGVVKQREAVGFRCIWIIIAGDPASFNPDGSSAAPAYGSAYPDGSWGWDTKYDAGTNTRVISRNPNAEYWRMPDE